LRFSKEIERRFTRCRASVRAAIRERLDSIASAAAKARGGKGAKPAARKEPPLRFYVYEGFRVVYQIDEQTRRVVILDLAVVAT
jgi:mRNA-degrading endonuclease RelE of RelBE toxin-antitoxin system